MILVLTLRRSIADRPFSVSNDELDRRASIKVQWNRIDCKHAIDGYRRRDSVHSTSDAHLLMAARLVEGCSDGHVGKPRGHCEYRGERL